jgi:uncharacterized protein (TIRG00374 family)
MRRNIKSRLTNWRTILTIVSFLAVAILVFALRDDIKQVFQTVDDLKYWFLFLMIPIQILNYHSYTRIYQRFFRILGKRLSYKNLLKVTLELNFINNVFPSGGVGGISYFGLRMRNFGVTTPQATLAQFMKFMLLFVSFQAILFFGLIALATKGKANDLLLLIAGSMATLLLVGTVFVTYIIGKQSRIHAFVNPFTKFINKAVAFIKRSKNKPDVIQKEQLETALNELHENFLIVKKNRSQMKVPLAYALLANATEVLSVYVVYLAFGSPVNIGAVIIAYAVANFAGVISVLPGGIGIFEALMTTVLVASGVPASLSISVTIMYRVLNSAIQLPLGYYFYQKALPEVGKYK